MDQLFWRDEARRIMQEQNKLLQNIAEQQTNLLLEISSKLDTLIQLLAPRK